LRAALAPGLAGGSAKLDAMEQQAWKSVRDGDNVPHGALGMRRVSPILGLVLLWSAGGMFPVWADDLNDYPTAVRADYVFGCMKANGETREALQRCSCSIDVIASLLPYDRYVAAETVLSMAQVPGALGSQFRSTEFAKVAVDELRRAQAEAEVRCF
jgi:hypothetical protein